MKTWDKYGDKPSGVTSTTAETTVRPFCQSKVFDEVREEAKYSEKVSITEVVIVQQIDVQKMISQG